MAAFLLKLLLFLAVYFAEKAQAQDNFGIAEPFPDNINPIEFTTAEVTCVAFDSAGVKIPEKILFMRKDQFAIYHTVTANDNIFFTNVTADTTVIGEGGEALNVTKLFVTLHIRNVTPADDSQNPNLGRYECHAFAVNDSLERKHGFSVNVIRRSEIPQVSVSKASVLQHGEDFTITCNLTGSKLESTQLKRVSWYKDGALLQSVRNPDPTEPRDSLGPLSLKSVGVRDGGNYTCLLEVLLRTVKEHNVSDSTKVEIAAWLVKPKEDLEFKKFKGKYVDFECGARGNPLQVEWKVQKKGEDKIQTCINESDGNYRIERKGMYDPYVLTVFDLQYTDRGFYYCCLPSNCSDNVEDNCQRFILRVRDPLGPLWPVIGILIEALLLFLIIFIAEKRKKSKEAADKQDGRVEFSFSSTDDGDRGQVRLRKVGETAVA